MESEVRVALGQIAIDSLAPENNLIRVEQACRAAASAQADLLVLPELADIGQVTAFDAAFAARYISVAETLDGHFVGTVKDLARELSIYVAMGVAEMHPSVPHTLFNTALLIGPSGAVAAAQRKLHLPGEERHYFAVGDQVEVVKTELGTISMQICYDLYFPEVARVAALRGAEILIGMANIPYRAEWPDRLSQLAGVRAYENMQHVVVVNRVGTNHDVQYGGESVAAVPPGLIALRCPPLEEHFQTVDLPADALPRERLRRPVFAVRRPELYREITRGLTPGDAVDG